MRIVCVSDTHSLHKYIEVPEGDILIHAGDFTKNGKIEAIVDFNDWLGTLPFPRDRILVIAGNHDLSFERTPELVEPLLTNCTYLRDSGVEIDGLSFYGSPWVPKFGNWAFMLEHNQINRRWTCMPDGIDVLITHGPPHGILDEVEGDGSVGCKHLRAWLQKNESVKLHVAGHLHEAYGVLKLPNRTYVNAAICNLEYQPVNPPIVIDL